ncbi:MAG: sigma-70 family RNA polymerase sigma factor [Phycisphaerales bacterium]
MPVGDQATPIPPASPRPHPQGWPSALDPESWLSSHGDVMWRFAMSRADSAHAAEEAIQETFEAALRSRDSFRGECTERTWLLSILRRRLADRSRRAAREPRPAGGGPGALLDTMFDRRGLWAIDPGAWPRDPDGTLDTPEFWSDFERCLARLPAGLAEAFVLREVRAQSPEGVCRALSITLDNLWVRLHRARLLLRRCLEPAWGKKGKRR